MSYVLEDGGRVWHVTHHEGVLEDGGRVWDVVHHELCT